MKKIVFLLTIFICTHNTVFSVSNFFSDVIEQFVINGRYTKNPFLRDQVFQEIADIVITDDSFEQSLKKISQLKKGAIIYLHGRKMDFFADELLPFIRVPFILISRAQGVYHNDFKLKNKDTIDLKYPLILQNLHDDNMYYSIAFQKILNNKYLYYWFGRDLDPSIHSKIRPIPLGIWRKQTTLPLFEIRKLQLPKKYFVYLNFTENLNLRGIKAASRHPVKKLFSDKEKYPFVIKMERKSFKEYVQDLASSYFVLSPRGFNIDCYRTWEALLCGSYPIAQHSILDSLFEDLPVVLIHDWEEVTQEFLEQKLQEFSQKKFKVEKLFAKYWVDQILDCQKELQDTPE